MARIKFHNYIPSEKHLWRPGTFPVDMRDDGNDCAPTAQAGAWTPSVVRANGANSAPPTVPSGEAKASLSLEALSEEEEACVSLFKEVIYGHTKLPTFGPPETRLRQAVRGLSIDSAHDVVRGLPKLEHPQGGVETIALGISEIRRHEAEALDRKRARLSLLSSIDLTGDEMLQAEKRALLEEVGEREVPDGPVAASG